MASTEPASPLTTDEELERLKRKCPPPAPPSPSTRPRYNARDRRVSAAAIDLFLIQALTHAPEVVIRSLARVGTLSVAGFSLRTEWLDVFQIGLFLLTMLITEVGLGQSPGKWWTGLHVVTARGMALTPPHRLWRHFVRWSPVYLIVTGRAFQHLDRSFADFPIFWAQLLLLVVLGSIAIPTAIGWIFILSENDRTTFHDILARTRVSDPEDVDVPGFEVVLKREAR